ncbi:hypothetical protein EI94DRAFT_119964 [Lactarius quietus]|nr:hypothetical protein EI94DRAFT_119964 [Lactarius quietus]
MSNTWAWRPDLGFILLLGFRHCAPWDAYSDTTESFIRLASVTSTWTGPESHLPSFICSSSVMQWKMLSSLAAITSLVLLSGDLVVAQVTAPFCTDFTSSWQWSYNSLDQSPCEVTAYMLSTCYGGSFNMAPLNLGSTSYAGPSTVEALGYDTCFCNTVIYNLASACGGCQGGIPISWSEYHQNCSTILSPATFPNPVPVGTEVPHWVSLDPTISNYWSASEAKLVGDAPEVSPGQLLVTPAIPPVVTTPVPTLVPTLSRTVIPEDTSAIPKPQSTLPSSSSSNSSGSGPTKGDITGGVVRGVTIAAAIAGLALSLYS